MQVPLLVGAGTRILAAREGHTMNGCQCRNPIHCILPQTHAEFADAADQCPSVLRGMFGTTSREAKAIHSAWSKVRL